MIRAFGLVLAIIAFCQATSVFSTNELGEDLGIFKYPFFEPANKSAIIFGIRPVYNLLYQDGNYRGVFWINPFHFSLNIVLPAQSALGVALSERFDQNFDIYTNIDTNSSYHFQRHIISRGGINELNISLTKIWADHLLTGFAITPLFGSTEELWEFNLINSGYTVSDTISYNYTGLLYTAGLGLKTKRGQINCYGEFGPELTAKSFVRGDEHTERVGLPRRFGAILALNFANYGAILQIEKSLWQQNHLNDAWRFKLGLATGSNDLSYQFNPWYIKGVNEHCLSFSKMLPVAKLGRFIIVLNLAIKNRENLYEVTFNPSLFLSFEEIFGVRKK